MPAISGEARLVPPTTSQGPAPHEVAWQRTNIPEFGSASAAMSGTPRIAPTIPEMPFWKDGRDAYPLMPPPPSSHAFSLEKTLVVELRNIVVPPTATTFGDV